MEIQKSQPTTNSIQPSAKGLTDDALDLFFQKKSILTHYGQSLAISGTLHHPSIGKLVKSNGEASMLVFITGLLNEFLSFVPNALNADEIVLYADKILAHCPTWTTADLVLCFKNGMDGKYGIVKYNWKWNVFIEWTQKYDQEKDDFFYKRHLSAKSEERVDVLKFIPKHIVEKFNKISAASDEKKPDISKIQIPNDVISQGLKAVDEYIEKHFKKK